LTIDFAEGSEGSGYAAQFVFEAGAFVLKFVDYSVHQSLCHKLILASLETYVG